MVALGHDALVAFDIAAKRVLAAEKEEEHVGVFSGLGSAMRLLFRDFCAMQRLKASARKRNS